MGKQLELPASLFFWWLAIEISFLPTMQNHNINGRKTTEPWQKTMNKVLVAFFVGFTLNLIEKIILQLIAISFHLRTYQDRIELNKFQIGSLAKLYKFSKEKIAMEDSEFEQDGKIPSGARTPGQLVTEAQKNIKEGFNKFGDIAGKVAGDFTGRQVTTSGHPNQVVLQLIGSTGGAQVLARRLYRTFARPETETIHSEDLKNAFESDEEAEAAFSMFDKDMNGDISMEELEAVCVEIGRERKSITASLKDLDSVVSKLDDVFMFIVLIITIIVFISLISTSAAGVLTSAGSTLLALSWLFSATAQEFLQSCIFVFIKHPYDVGDRVMVYGNSGDLGRGDDYFVKEIALFYTEFKKMQGHIVQAPNSYLNTLFIMNHRRSGALAEAVPIIIKFGTTLEQIDRLRQCLLQFVTDEKREYRRSLSGQSETSTDIDIRN
jgi:small-conductance mechanosensitive channel